MWYINSFSPADSISSRYHLHHRHRTYIQVFLSTTQVERNGFLPWWNTTGVDWVGNNWNDSRSIWSLLFVWVSHTNTVWSASLYTVHMFTVNTHTPLVCQHTHTHMQWVLATCSSLPKTSTYYWTHLESSRNQICRTHYIVHFQLS